MAYASWSVVFGEQPSTAKWNILGTNDASFNDGTGIASLTHSTTTVTNPYKFRAYRNAALTLTSGAATKLVCDVESYDSNSNFATGTYTVPVSGFYHFSGRISATTTRMFISIYVGGVETARGMDVAYSSSIMGPVISVDLQLSATNTVDLYYFSAGAVSLDVGSTQSYFAGHLISRL